MQISTGITNNEKIITNYDSCYKLQQLIVTNYDNYTTEQSKHLLEAWITRTVTFIKFLLNWD